MNEFINIVAQLFNLELEYKETEDKVYAYNVLPADVGEVSAILYGITSVTNFSSPFSKMKIEVKE